MNTRTLLATAVASAGLFVVPTAFAQEVTVPNALESGEPAEASDVMGNFEALANEIESLGQQTTGAAFADYFLSPSSASELGSRNVIVWDNPDNNCYIARGWFDNPGGITQSFGPEEPDTINVWQMLCTDGAGTLTYELEYVYTLPADGFDGEAGVAINEDEDGDRSFENQEEAAYRFKTNVESLGQTEIRNSTELYLDENGEVLFANNWVRNITQLDETITVNGIEFDDVAVSHFDGFERIRFLANGIGPILEVDGFQGDPVFSSQQTQNGVIFYRIDGNERGSLEGTPFVDNSPINQWFAQ